MPRTKVRVGTAGRFARPADFAPVPPLAPGTSIVLASSDGGQTFDLLPVSATAGGVMPGNAQVGSLDVTLADGSSGRASRIVAPAGSTLHAGVLLLAASGGGGTGGGTGATDYAVFLVAPETGVTVDVAPIHCRVRVLPEPPANTLVRVFVDGLDVAQGLAVGEFADVTVPAQAVGSHELRARVSILGVLSYSVPAIVTVASQLPTVTLVAPADETDFDPAQPLATAVIVRHATALHDDFVVQVSGDNWAHLETAVWVSGEPTDPGGARFEVALSLPIAGNYWVQGRAYDATPGAAPVYSGTAHVCSLPDAIPITVEGATFNPQVELWSDVPDATVTWTPSEGEVQTGLEPNWNWGSVAQRTVSLVVHPWRALRVLNFGFNRADDTGREALSTTYNRPNQNVSAIGNPGRAINLYAFLAAHNPLAGTLDLTGFSRLVWIECFQSSLSSVLLAGCTSLRRLCFEQCNLSYLDIRDQSASLYDLRAAAQQGGALEIRTGVNVQQYHWCTRSQQLTVRNATGTIVTGQDFYDLLPAIQECWDFQCGRTGALRPRSPYTQSIQSFGNHFSSLDVANQFPSGRSGEILASGNAFTAIDLSGCPGLVSVDLSHCGLSTALVDYVLYTMNSFGTSNIALDLHGNAGPSSSEYIAELQARGCSVTTEPVVVGGTNLDEFDRAAGAVGNGWGQVLGTVTGAINGSQQLVLNAAAYAVYENPGVALPGNYRVETTIPDATLAIGFFGLVARWANGTGVRLLFWSRNGAHMGDANGYDANPAAITITNDYPASWYLNQPHTLALECVGTRCAIICDGQEYGYATIATNAGMTGTGYGICGESSNRVFERMAAVGL